jgi:hypothetical protein
MKEMVSGYSLVTQQNKTIHMKTAMQELIDKLSNSIKFEYRNELVNALEKEKEQMLDFGLYVKKNGWVGCKIEDLYEDYNNQNK